MPRQCDARVRVPYVGQENVNEQLLPDDPSEDELALQRLESECRHLRQENAHLRSASATASRVLEPYSKRLNGRQP